MAKKFGIWEFFIQNIKMSGYARMAYKPDSVL